VSLIVNATTTFANCPTGYRRAAGNYLVQDEPPESADFGNRNNVADGVDGAGNAQAGFRGRTIGPFLVCVVAADNDAANLALATLIQAWEALVAGFTVVCSSGTYESCYLTPGSGKALGHPQETEAGTYWIEAMLIFTQERLNT